MEIVRIFMSGAMGSISYEEQTQWRQKIINAIKYNYECEKKPIFFNPVNYFNYEEVRYKSQREVMNFDLNALKKSDLILVNFNDPSSLGTCAELATAYNMKIPIVGINEEGKKLHPWLESFCDRICESIREAVEYVVEFYLN